MANLRSSIITGKLHTSVRFCVILQFFSTLALLPSNPSTEQKLYSHHMWELTQNFYLKQFLRQTLDFNNNLLVLFMKFVQSA